MENFKPRVQSISRFKTQEDKCHLLTTLSWVESSFFRKSKESHYPMWKPPLNSICSLRKIRTKKGKITKTLNYPQLSWIFALQKTRTSIQKLNFPSSIFLHFLSNPTELHQNLQKSKVHKEWRKNGLKEVKEGKKKKKKLDFCKIKSFFIFLGNEIELNRKWQ